MGKHYQVNGNNLSKHYKKHLSGYEDWDQYGHAEDWILFPENTGEYLCLDEVALSDGELYTVLTDKKSATQKGCLICMIKGTKSENVLKVIEKIPYKIRGKVKEISVDMANSMSRIAREGFPNANIVTDRFHVAQLVSTAVQEMRIKLRWQAIDQENKAIKQAKQSNKKYLPKTFENGDTKKQLLARSRYLLFKSKSKWTESQKQRADILFREFPEINKGYEMAMMFRNIYETAKSVDHAQAMLCDWYEKIEEKDFPSFNTAAESIQKHQDTILNFFLNRTTNAMAENFNSKIKSFRAVFRGVRDINFFLYRVSLIFA